ncbi:hypothetical protein VS884_25835, partial [Escherichia coli]
MTPISLHRQKSKLAKSYALNSPRKPQAITAGLSTLLLSLILNGALQIHGKLRTMTPISLHRQKSKLAKSYAL